MRSKSLVWIAWLFIVLALGLYSVAQTTARAPTATPRPMQQPTPSPSGMDMTMPPGPFSSDELAPLVRGIYAGEDMFFIHTEASDVDVAGLLTDMMGPEVVVVPSLAKIPEALRGNVYVFTNGIAGGGPMGFQPDIFDSVPPDPDYTPLRTLNLVTWQAGIRLRQLNSVAEVEVAETAGEIVVEQPGIVINMPILTWPGGHR